MYQSISSIFRQPGASKASGTSAPAASKRTELSQTLTPFSVKNDSLDALAQRLGHLQASSEENASDVSNERSFPFLDEDSTEGSVAPTMARTSAKSGTPISDESIFLHVPVEDGYSPSLSPPSPPANTPATPDALEYLFSPRQDLVETTSIHHMICVPAPPPPSPVLGSVPVKKLDWVALAQRWQ